MILVKIEGVMGDVTLEKYENWFVAKSFSFPVGETNGRDDLEDDDVGDLDLDDGPEKRKKNTRNNRTRKKPKASVSYDGAYLELTIDKEADAASVYLMQLAMMSRAGAVDNKYLKVDIHVMEQKVQGKESSNTTRPYIVIRLERAIVSGWSLNGDDKGLATEEVTLWYDRAAMKFITYLSKESKDVKQVHGPLGWNVDQKEAWSCSDLAKDK